MIQIQDLENNIDNKKGSIKTQDNTTSSTTGGNGSEAFQRKVIEVFITDPRLSAYYGVKFSSHKGYKIRIPSN